MISKIWLRDISIQNLISSNASLSETCCSPPVRMQSRLGGWVVMGAEYSENLKSCLTGSEPPGNLALI